MIPGPIPGSMPPFVGSPSSSSGGCVPPPYSGPIAPSGIPGPFLTGATVYETTWPFLGGAVPPCCAPGSYVLTAASPQGIFNVSVSQAGLDATVTVTAAVDISASVTQDVVLNYTDCNGDPQTMTITLPITV